MIYSATTVATGNGEGNHHGDDGRQGTKRPWGDIEEHSPHRPGREVKAKSDPLDEEGKKVSFPSSSVSGAADVGPTVEGSWGSARRATAAVAAVGVAKFNHDSGAGRSGNMSAGDDTTGMTAGHAGDKEAVRPAALLTVSRHTRSPSALLDFEQLGGPMGLLPPSALGQDAGLGNGIRRRRGHGSVGVGSASDSDRGRKDGELGNSDAATSTSTADGGLRGRPSPAPAISFPSVPGRGPVHPTAAASASSSSFPSSSDAVAASTSLGAGAAAVSFRDNPNVALIDRSIAYASLASVVTWLILLFVTYRTTRDEYWVTLTTGERYVSALAAALIFASLSTKLAPMLVKGGARRAMRSGVLTGAVAVQGIAATTDVLMAILDRVPVIVDPFTGARVYPLRYCEWTVLAFLMTYITEGVHVPEDEEDDGGGHRRRPQDRLHSRRRGQMKDRWRVLRWPVLMGASQGLSTACGLVFPHCPSLTCWLVVMTISCILYLVMFPRWTAKRRRLRCAAEEQRKRGGRNPTVDEIERYDRIRLSYRLLTTCLIMWTMLVVTYFFTSFGHWFVSPVRSTSDDDAGAGGNGDDHRGLATLRALVLHPSLSFFAEALIDVMAKALYMDIIVDVHQAVFDDGARSVRRLEELRRMMSVVWESSSDVIAISVRAGGGGGVDSGPSSSITTMVSPSFRKIEAIREEEDDGAGKGSGRRDGSGRVPSDGKDGVEDRGHEGDDAAGTNHDPIVFEMRGGGEYGDGAHPSVDDALRGGGGRIYFRGRSMDSSDQPALLSIKGLMLKAWAASSSSSHNNDDGGEILLVHDVHLRDGTSIRCEAKATRVGSNALVVVVRDVSERFRRFEAEKRAVLESTARQKDAEANRFTRHEVKNGLLASIGLCDGLREALAEEGAGGGGNGNGEVGASSSPPSNSEAVRTNATGVYRFISDLDATLREILDTVLAEAMARDVIHEVYEPRMERVDLESALCGWLPGRDDRKRGRFPLVTDPSPLPTLLLDPQLLRYVHRNAVSNACKYGKRGGVVLTEVKFDTERNELSLDVINLPGSDHERLLSLGDVAREAVFAPGRRLHGNNDDTNDFHHQQTTQHSSGDGAWISQKCARTLGGDCTIRFEPDRTVFSLRCPAKPYDVVLRLFPGTVGDPSNFHLPEDTWGVAIDDSKIQRKLMKRFFALAGIPEERQVLLGRDGDEIRGFNDVVIRLMTDNPTSYFLVIADENLDIMEHNNRCHTVSGSLCIQRLRRELDDVHERRMLALVRSANDSASDVAIYNSRAHGFLCKAPIKRDKIIEMLAPMWTRRFAVETPHLPRSESASELARRQSSSSSSLRAQPPRRQFDTTDANVSMAVNLMQTVEVIDALCCTIQNNDSPLLSIRWPLIREKLRSLRDDLGTFDQSQGQCVSDIIYSIHRLDGNAIPHNFISRWAFIRAQIIRVI